MELYLQRALLQWLEGNAGFRARQRCYRLGEQELAAFYPVLQNLGDFFECHSGSSSSVQIRARGYCGEFLVHAQGKGFRRAGRLALGDWQHLILLIKRKNRYNAIEIIRRGAACCAQKASAATSVITRLVRVIQD